MTDVGGSVLPRRLRHCHNIADLRKAAKKALPFPLFDHVDGGSDDETTLLLTRTPLLSRQHTTARRESDYHVDGKRVSRETNLRLICTLRLLSHHLCCCGVGAPAARLPLLPYGATLPLVPYGSALLPVEA